MKLTNVEHVFFDLDHTLWDFDKNSRLAYAKIFEKHSIAIDLKAFLEVYEPINFQYWKWYREERVTKKQLRHGRIKRSFDALNVGINDQLIDKLSEDYITYLPDNNHLFDGTFEILEYLQQKYTLHIITNGFEEVQITKLSKSEIASFFKTVTSSEAAGVKKPNPRIFHKAVEVANAHISKSVMIGDTYEADIVGANNIGMRSICFDYHKAKMPENQLVIDHLLELKNFL